MLVKDLIECIEKANKEFFKLKEELGIKKDIENWGNMSVSIVKKLKRYHELIIYYAITGGKNKVHIIKRYSITTPKEEIQKTEEYKKAKRLTELFQVIKYYRELGKACERVFK